MSSWRVDTHPARADLPTGHHLRPIRASDVDIDYSAVMGSRERLWEKFGATWGWPPETMSFEADREDLARHEAEAEANEAFNYAVLNADESELLGCIYIDPSEEFDAQVSWWVVDELVGSELERTLDEFVPRWLRETWGFSRVDYSP